MKNYSTTVAAQKLVSQRVSLGTSRHESKKKNLGVITSVGTARNHQNTLKCAADWLLEAKGKHLKNMDEVDVAEFLTLRALTVGQSAVDLSRQAINFHLLFEDPVPFIPSQIETKLTNRAYTDSQIELMLAHANPKMRLSIRIARSGGTRAMELVTIAPTESMQESIRDGWIPERFSGREDELTFVVHGKGGLRREVRLPIPIATELFQRARPEPVIVTSREVRYLSFFDLTGGVNFSAQFSELSMKVLGFSNGAHGLRHTFAQRRLYDLMCRGLDNATALNVLSNELGHFCNVNTFAYLRE